MAQVVPRRYKQMKNAVSSQKQFARIIGTVIAQTDRGDSRVESSPSREKVNS
jgi:hypothetical protein